MFLADSRRLIFSSGSRVFLVDSDGGEPKELISFEPDTVGAVRLSSDDRYLYVTRETAEADIWLLELGDNR